MITRSQFLTLAAIGAATACLGTHALAQGTIKIGELSSYKSQPAFLDPYKKGWSWQWRRSTPRAAFWVVS